MTTGIEHSVEALTGDAIPAVIDDLAGLRVAVFREWPYLYEGSMDYERGYLEDLARAPSAVVVVARCEDRIVGGSTGLALTEADAAFRAPFEDGDPGIDEVFYFGESVLLPEHRGKGLGHRFFDLREAHARALGFGITAFCAVQRDPDDPRRPEDYRPLDGFWEKRGYRRQPDRVAEFAWPEVGGDGRNVPHRLVFRIRDSR
ncbi:MAG: GNAT family N-acetyltransferase [Wenzhouxiangellaceae bacterium]|nr:GNAT family N-acetyltransferase [Wenzhouxiangellaceae bacterium]